MYELTFENIFSVWGHSTTPISTILSDFLRYLGILKFILIIPFSYLLSCIIIPLFKILRRNKALIIPIIIIVILLLGFDEPVINYTINKPNYSCSVDTDCQVKSISKGWCGNHKCVNSKWEYYDSLINTTVNGLSCLPPMIYCSCIQNMCESISTYGTTKIEDCNKLKEYEKEICIDMLESNIKNFAN